MDLVLIAAVSENNVIGLNGKIPWNIPEDMKRFREVTSGHPIIMGRKTFESLPKKPLPNRSNIILTRNPNLLEKYLDDPNVYVARDLEHSFSIARESDGIVSFVIGGSEIYKEAINKVDRLDITLVHKDCVGDAFFPEINSRIWREESRENREGYSFVKYSRI